MEKKDNNETPFKKKLNILEELNKSESKFINFNDERIEVSRLCQKYLTREDLNIIYSAFVHSFNLFNIKSFKKCFLSDIRVKYWLKFSSDVVTKKILGFPIALKTIDSGEKCHILFENLERSLYRVKSNDYITNVKITDQIMFQKLFIMYKLFVNNCYTDFPLFKIYNIPSSKIIFKVKDIFFEFDLTKLVVLSEETDFIVNNLIDEDVYISKLVDNDFKFIDCNSFIKTFLYTFKDYISMFYIISKIPPIIEEQKLTSFNPGEYACLKARDIVSVIILSEFDDMCEVVQFGQNSHVIMNVNKDNLIRKPKLLYNRSNRNILNYIIGEDF